MWIVLKELKCCITLSGFSWDPKLEVAVHHGNTDQSITFNLISLYFCERFNMEKIQ